MTVKALKWLSPDGSIGWLVDTMHPSRLAERLHTFGDFPELHAEILDVEIDPLLDFVLVTDADEPFSDADEKTLPTGVEP